MHVCWIIENMIRHMCWWKFYYKMVLNFEKYMKVNTSLFSIIKVHFDIKYWCIEALCFNKWFEWLFPIFIMVWAIISVILNHYWFLHGWLNSCSLLFIKHSFFRCVSQHLKFFFRKIYISWKFKYYSSTILYPFIKFFHIFSYLWCNFH